MDMNAIHQDHLKNNMLIDPTIIERSKTADEARQHAIDWQSDAAEWDFSYGELADAAAVFTALADKFPELRDEFVENGII